ncbi:MAG: serine protease [Patescibacteria group bacterium]
MALETINRKPAILKAVRAVGIIKPKFDPQQQGFIPPQLEIMGTAFLLKDFNIIVTCAHVIQKFINLPVELGGMLVIGKEANYQPISIDNLDFVHDLAVLRFRKNVLTPQEMFDQMIKAEFENGLFISECDPVVSDGTMYAGYPLGNILLNSKHDPSYSEGVISVCDRENEFGRKEFQISGSIVGGYSGSPVTLKSNPQKVVGIVSNSPSKEAGDAGIFMAVSYKHIKALAELSNS